MLESVLVPLDGSKLAEAALPTAVGLAQRTGARLWLVRVHGPMAGGLAPEVVLSSADRIDREARTGEAAYVQRMALRLWGTEGVSARGVLVDGPVPLALSLAAGSCEARVIVMASHRRRSLDRALYGSVVDALVRRVQVPILIAGTGPSARFRRILLPVDGTADMKGLLRAARAVAGSRADVMLVDTHSPSRPETIARFAGAGDLIAVAADSRNRLVRLLREGLADRVVLAAPAVPVLLVPRNIVAAAASGGDDSSVAVAAVRDRRWAGRPRAPAHERTWRALEASDGSRNGPRPGRRG